MTTTKTADVEGTLAQTWRQGPVAFLLDEGHEASGGNEGYRVLGLAQTHARQLRTKADAHLRHRNAESLGHDEVPELVGEDEQAREGQKVEQIHRARA